MTETGKESSRAITARWTIVTMTVALTAGALLYRVLLHQHLGQTAAMFLGIPAVLAILLAFTPEAKSLTGGILKGITLFLLIIAPLLGEGYLCILIASPLFYAVGIVIGLILDSRRNNRGATLSCVALIALPMCLEGVLPELTFHRDQTVQSTRILNATPQQIEAALSQSPNLDAPLPFFLRIGFPRPLAAYGGGLAIGAVRTVHFAGAEGDPPGDVVSRVTERGPGFARVETISDTTKLTQWLRWQSSEVEWHAVDAQRTSVTWRVNFERELDPAWYFVPWERVAVREAAGYLIEANASPQWKKP